MRKEYSSEGLVEANVPKVPFELFNKWFEEAVSARMHEPNAMCLSTADAAGKPSARFVLMKGYDERGFVWYTNYESRKSN